MDISAAQQVDRLLVWNGLNCGQCHGGPSTYGVKQYQVSVSVDDSTYTQVAAGTLEAVVGEQFINIGAFGRYIKFQTITWGALAPAITYLEILACGQAAATTTTTQATTSTTMATTTLQAVATTTTTQAATMTTPDKVTSGTLLMWFDASDKDTVKTSGSKVVTWKDKSGNAYHLNAPSGSEPTYKDESAIAIEKGGEHMVTTKLASGIMAPPLHLFYQATISDTSTTCYLSNDYNKDVFTLAKRGTQIDFNSNGQVFARNQLASVAGTEHIFEATCMPAGAKSGLSLHDDMSWPFTGDLNCQDPLGFAIGDTTHRTHSCTGTVVSKVLVFKGKLNDADRKLVKDYLTAQAATTTTTTQASRFYWGANKVYCSDAETIKTEQECREAYDELVSGDGPNCDAGTVNDGANCKKGWPPAAFQANQWSDRHGGCTYMEHWGWKFVWNKASLDAVKGHHNSFPVCKAKQGGASR
jgi:hypothetical protein